MKDYIVKIFKKSSNLKEAFVSENLDKIVRVVEIITVVLESGSKILIFGNGGSAADAQHIAAEFIARSIPAIALTTDTSVITSIGNDYGFDEIFSRQIMALGKKGDVAWGISTSGSSRNVIKAFEVAKKMGMVMIGMTGNDGGDIAKKVHYSLNVSSHSTPRIQEVHIALGHIICEMVRW